MNTIFSSKYILPFSAVAVALVVVLGFAFLSNQNSEPQQTSPNIELVKNMEYYDAECDTRVKLQNGISEQVNYPCKGETLSGFLIRIYNEKIAFGDLTHDGEEEAAVILSANYGGSGDFRRLVIIGSQSGNTTEIVSKDLGDRVIVNTISIQDSRIVLDILTHASQDPACCPTKEEVVEYELINGNELRRI